MKTSLKYREVLTDARRVVVKIGSRVLVQSSGRPDTRRMRALVREIALLHRSRDVAIVTSGAIAAGIEALGMKERPEALPELQMAAAVGQTRLMCRYDELFHACNCKVGQVLLTHGDFLHKMRLSNASRTLESLFRHKVIPIINENDVVADEEIRADKALGDNDYLASLVAKVVRADLLILLTTVDGLRERGPSGRTHRIRYVENINRATYRLVEGGPSKLSKGGMATKLKAAQAVTRAGCSAVIANGRETGILTSILDGKDRGTMVVAAGV